ncbi:KI18B protein, partial [Steatornis caripensis]|nr:KI18B protein [Steatornis caripensis]
MALGSLPEEGTVAVVVRVRPPTPREQAAQPILRIVDEHVLILNPEEPNGPPGSVRPIRGPKPQGKDLKFVFDRVFGEEATQEEVFQHTTREVLDSVLNGYNCSVFAYGATGAGKTHTMLGSESSPGIMYLSMVELYKRIEARREDKSCEVLVSYQEVYNEQIHDLLEPKGPLTIWEDPEKGVVVQGLSFHQPASAEQLLEMLASGNKKRTQHPTDANATSSRSHAIFQIYVKQQDRVGGLTGDLQVSKMSLIDLAGSERASVTKAKGERLREGANINRSLLALINVINALADAKSKKTHIPYRDSKLTRLLKDSIGSNCRTIMIAAVSPSVLAYEDTYNTLKYTSRAKEIKLSLKSNVSGFHCRVGKYAMICEQLKAEVRRWRAGEGSVRSCGLLGTRPSELTEVVKPPEQQMEAVLKTHSGLDDCTDSDGKQQELEAGQPDFGSLLQVPEETPASSPRATNQRALQLGLEKWSCRLQRLSGRQPETLIAAILRVAQKQYSVLKAANLLTPDMAAEFDDLERVICQEAGVSLEQAASPNRPAEVSGAAPAQSVQQGCDGEDMDLGRSVLSPVTSPPLLCLQELSSSSVEKSRGEVNSVSQSGTPSNLKTQMKCQWGSGGEAGTPRETQSPGTPCLRATAQAPPVSPVPACGSPKICPWTVESCVPLAVLTAQNSNALLALPVHDLNVTFRIHEIDGSPCEAQPVSLSQPEFWENIQSLQNRQDSPFGPK